MLGLFSWGKRGNRIESGASGGQWGNVGEENNNGEVEDGDRGRIGEVLKNGIILVKKLNLRAIRQLVR